MGNYFHPSSGPVHGGTSITVRHHKTFSAMNDSLLLGVTHLNCTTKGVGTTSSRCCCTPPFNEYVHSTNRQPIEIVSRERTRPQQISTGVQFSYYTDPTLLRIFPSRSGRAGGLPITIAAAGWPSSTGPHAQPRCRFGPTKSVSATMLEPNRHRPAGETWLRCIVPALDDERDGDVSVSVAPNGVDFVHRGQGHHHRDGRPTGADAGGGINGSSAVLAELMLQTGPATSLWETVAPPTESMLPHALLAVLCAAILFALMHAYAMLQRALDSSGWLVNTPSHCLAARYHGALCNEPHSWHSDLAIGAGPGLAPSHDGPPSSSRCRSMRDSSPGGVRSPFFAASLGRILEVDADQEHSDGEEVEENDGRSVNKRS